MGKLLKRLWNSVYGELPWWQRILMSIAYITAFGLGILLGTILATFFETLDWPWWVWIIITWKIPAYSFLIPSKRFINEHYPDYPNWKRSLMALYVAGRWPASLYHVVRAVFTQSGDIAPAEVPPKANRER